MLLPRVMSHQLLLININKRDQKCERKILDFKTNIERLNLKFEIFEGDY